MANMKLGWSGSKLEDWLNQNGKLSDVIGKIIWNLQNEILSGKRKDTALHQKLSPTQTQNGEQLVQQQFGTEDLDVIQAKNE